VSEPAGVTLPARLQEVEPVRSIRTFARLEYQYTPGRAASRFLREVEKKRLVGQRCPVCKKVYVPPRGSCPVDGVATEEEVELGHSGTIVSFCVVNVPFMANLMEIPYVGALIQLDGSDIPIMHLIQEVPYDEVHPGMRVEAVWVPDEEISHTLESITHFRPNGEPDAPFDSYKDNA
jgi:uncharacterized OB-fold protein